MALESAADFNSYLDSTTGHGVTATFFEVQNSLFDQRVGFIDSWFDIDSGNRENINIIIDQEYFDIAGNSVAVEGFQPKALVKSSDVPYISHEDRLIVNAITTNKGTVLKAETTFVIKNVQPDNTGFIELILEEQ
jgi:hypothetical protein|nr:hypothetical protein [uncultured Mediterranean phage uvMED]|tara:strand:- start:3601 stop:4005 length:405 start_codon:yes stop_codon:yes gene_type:complete